MYRPSINKCAEVLLEAVMVFICLALIAVVVTRLFANLNFNMLDRLQVYRNSRLAAVNNFLSPVLPTQLLDYSPRTGLLSERGSDRIDLTPEIPEGLFNESFLEEPRMVQAAVLLEELDSILNIILPYKVNQANSLAHQLHLKAIDPPAESEDDWVWVPEENIAATETLVGRSIQLTERAYNGFCQAIELYKDVYNNPTIPGPFDPIDPNDPNLEDHLALYGLNPDDTQAIQNLRNQNNANRQNLQDTINSLESVKPNLEDFKDIIIEGIEGGDAYLGLEYVIEGDHLGSRSCYTKPTCPICDPPEITICEPAPEHTKAVETLTTAVDFVGDIASPFLNSDLVDNINQLYSLLETGVSSPEQAESAAALSLSILNDAQVQANSNLKTIAQSLNDNLNSSIEHWDDEAIRNDYLDFSFSESWGLYEVANLSTS